MADIIRVKAPGGAEQLEQTSVELPPPGPDEVRLRQIAIGVNFIDIYHRLGLYPLPDAKIPGVEAVGVVSAVGSEVTALSVGDRIAYAGAPVGAYASERNLPAWRAVKLLDGVADGLAASLFVKGVTAHMLFKRIYPVGPGVTILVHSAAGGLGQLLTRWAVHLGATVIGTVGSDAKADVARAAGAHHVIIGRAADFAAAVADLTNRRGVDVAYDGVGGATLARTLACARPFGVVASLGQSSVGQSAGSTPLLNLDDLGRRSLMLARPSVMAYMSEPAAYREAATGVLDAMAAGVLGGEGKAYRFSEAARAHADLEAGRTTGALYLKL
jgi:NADPH:quinone reductase